MAGQKDLHNCMLCQSRATVAKPAVDLVDICVHTATADRLSGKSHHGISDDDAQQTLFSDYRSPTHRQQGCNRTLVHQKQLY